MQNLRRPRYDWTLTVLPLVLLVLITSLLLTFPEATGSVIRYLRNLFGNEFGVYYLVLGFAFIVISLCLAFSKYGKVKLGKLDKPKFSTFSWGAMIFTSTMAADILFYSLHEWMYYWNSTPLDFNEMTTAEKVTWSETYTMFHWGVTPWIFYILPAVAYAYMMHVKGRDKQRLSEACRPILGSRVDRGVGKTIDIISVLGLLLATATTFALATPLLSGAICKVTGLENSIALTISVLLCIAAVYTIAVLTGFKGINRVSTLCVIFFFLLASIFLFCGDTRFIVENAVNSLGNLTQNFIRMSTWTDPMRNTNFPQDWTVYYWAYWIAWSIATPFFIAKISEGRTIKNTIIGGLISGLLGTFTSFSVFGGFGIAEQAKGNIQIAEKFAAGEDVTQLILEIFGQLGQFSWLALVVLVLTMICFYASTFDAITYVVASYSYKRLGPDGAPSKICRVYWSVLFILFPCALLFTGETIYSLQSISIIAAFPISLILILVVASFIKDIRKDIRSS